MDRDLRGLQLREHRTADVVGRHPDVTLSLLERDEAEARLKGGLQTLGSYAVQRAAEGGTGPSATNSPQHMAKFRLSIPGPARQSSASVEWQYLGRRTTLGGGSVAPRATADVTFRQPVGRSFEISFGARNLFNQRYADPVSDAYMQHAILQNGRTLRVGVQWAPRTR